MFNPTRASSLSRYLKIRDLPATSRRVKDRVLIKTPPATYMSKWHQRSRIAIEIPVKRCGCTLMATTYRGALGKTQLKKTEDRANPIRLNNSTRSDKWILCGWVTQPWALAAG